MSTLPLISVIIPAHNNEETISEAIESILEQTYPHLEILIVDDHSTDGTLARAREFESRHGNLRVFSLPFDDPKRVNSRGRNVNAGYMARNYGLDKAKGSWITFQDADDASMVNRIQAQYDFAIKHDVEHICLQWQQLTESRLGGSFDVASALSQEMNLYTSSEDIVRLAQKTRGLLMWLLGPLRKYVPFEIKRLRYINKLFFGSLESYPGTGNSPLFKKDITKTIRFRQSDERVWPSFTGRGADRDFNFQVALRGNSMTVALPLYLYRVDRENTLPYDFEKYNKTL